MGVLHVMPSGVPGITFYHNLFSLRPFAADRSKNVARPVAWQQEEALIDRNHS